MDSQYQYHIAYMEIVIYLRCQWYEADQTFLNIICRYFFYCRHPLVVGLKKVI